MTTAQPAHKRILLKLSGEALMGDDAFGINRATIVRMVQEVAQVVNMGVQVAVVIGGGNIFRGVAGGSVGMDRATADYMGMLATVMNSLALADTMEKAGLSSGINWTCAGFYGPQGRNLHGWSAYPHLLAKAAGFRIDFGGRRQGITLLEMKTAGLYGLSRLMGHRAVSVSALLAHRLHQRFCQGT